jgi:hypothetical protein
MLIYQAQRTACANSKRRPRTAAGCARRAPPTPCRLRAPRRSCTTRRCEGEPRCRWARGSARTTSPSPGRLAAVPQSAASREARAGRRLTCECAGLLAGPVRLPSRAAPSSPRRQMRPRRALSRRIHASASPSSPSPRKSPSSPPRRTTSSPRSTLTTSQTACPTSPS